MQLSPNDSLVLKSYSPADAAALFALVDRNRARLREWLPWLDKNKSAADSAFFINASLKTEAENKAPTLGIWHDGALAGTVSFHPIQWANKCTALGYWIDSAASGRGLVTQSVRALITHGFGELGLERIELRCATGNVASQRVAERLGFTREGTLRHAEWLYDHWVDHCLFALIREDWKG